MEIGNNILTLHGNLYEIKSYRFSFGLPKRKENHKLILDRDVYSQKQVIVMGEYIIEYLQILGLYIIYEVILIKYEPKLDIRNGYSSKEISETSRANKPNGKLSQGKRRK